MTSSGSSMYFAVRGVSVYYDKVRAVSDISLVMDQGDVIAIIGANGAGKTTTLRGGEQQMLAIGRALMARPKLLLMDEPSLGLAPHLVREIARAILAVNREERVAVVLVEQNSRMALKISTRAYVLETGQVALEGRSADLLNNEQVRRLYLGG